MHSPTIVNLPPAPGESTSREDVNNPSPRLSSPWQPDPTAHTCTACHCPFDAFQRRHHCRLCGFVFCQSCSSTRSLIPPTALVLRSDSTENISFVSQNSRDGDDVVSSNGPSLEYRIHQARLPQRTCDQCHVKLEALQEELREKNSNAMRYNFVNAAGLRPLFNSPLAFTLGHEVRKAAYALGNLLPKGRRTGPFVSHEEEILDYSSYPLSDADQCQNSFKLDLTLKNVDKIHIPSRLLQKAKGIAIVTCAKGGLGFAGVEFGTGLVVARTDDGNDSNKITWSAPSAIGLAGFAWGALIGAQVSDHIFLLMTNEAVRLFSTQDASIQLGVDVGVAVGPMGRSAEADLVASLSSGSMAMAPIYTYSLSKGLYAGVSMDGRVVFTRAKVNEKFYGRALRAEELLSGGVPMPPAAQPLYDAIRRCLVYDDNIGKTVSSIGNRIVRDDPSIPERNEGTMDSPNPIPIPGGLMERLSHSTGLGLPIASPPTRTENLYNLSARHDPTWQPNFSE